MLQIIGFVAIAWLAISALVIAIAVAAGRADRAFEQATPRVRAKARRARTATPVRGAAAEQRVPAGVRAAIR